MSISAGAFSSGVLLYGMSLGLRSRRLNAARGSRNCAAGADAADGTDTSLVSAWRFRRGHCVQGRAAPLHVGRRRLRRRAAKRAAFCRSGVKAASSRFARSHLRRWMGDHSVGRRRGWPGWELALGVLAAVAMTWAKLAAPRRKRQRLLAYSGGRASGYARSASRGKTKGYTDGFSICGVVAMNLGPSRTDRPCDGRREGDELADSGFGRSGPGMAAL